jgi:hypothetical protein
VNVSGQNFFLDSQSNLPVAISGGSATNFQISFKPGTSSSYSGQFTVMGPGGKSIYVGPISGQGRGSNGNSATSILTVSTANLAFGNLTVGSASTQSVTLASTGTAPVTISSATLSGSGFTLSGGAFPGRLNPGQSLKLNVQFDPTTAGAASGKLTIQSDSVDNSAAVVTLSGTGMPVASPQLTLSTADLTFGNVTVNSASTLPETLTSTGTAPVTINSARPTGTRFTVSGSNFPVTLNPGQSVTLKVQFDPTAAGAASGQLTIQSNSSTNGTAVVNLSGTGTTAPSSQLTLSAASLTFGNVTVNTASTQPVTLTSIGIAPVTINSAALTGTGFTVLGPTFPVTLNPSQSVTLNVQFDPTTTGVASGRLTIQSDSSTDSTAVVNLNGTGTAATSPQLTLSAASLTFGDVTVNTASTQPVALTSTGTAPVTIQSAATTGAVFTVSGGTFPVTLHPGQSVTLNVQFQPTATGVATDQLTIQSDSSTNGTAVVSLSGTGTAATSQQLTLSAVSLLFGDVALNMASTQPVTLTSTGTAPVTINSATLTGSGFTVSGSTFPVTLNPGQSVTLNVQFDPATAGTISGQVAIQSDSSTNSTAVVNLSGTGTATVVPNPMLAIGPASLSFGNVTVNMPATLPVTLTSGGTAPVTINSAALTGTGFTMSGVTFPVTLNPTQSVTLNVQFNPTATGAVTGQLTIQSNSSTDGTAIIGLSGTGTAVAGVLSGFSCSRASLTGAGSDTCTVTLSSPAGSGGVSVGLSSSSTAVTVPATVVVPANATSTGFTATVTSVTTAQSVTLTASTGGMSKTFGLQLISAVPVLTVSLPSLAFGNVTLNTPSTLPLTLTSTGTSPVTINSATLTGIGFTISGVTFPVTLNPTQSVALNVQFDPTSTGAMMGQLTIQSNSSTNSTAVVGLSGTGTAAPGTLSSLTCSSASLTGAGSDSCTVTLSSAAGNSGVSVGLSSSSTAVAVPATVVVPANATSAGFTAMVTSVTTAQSATLTASTGGLSRTFSVHLNAAVPTLTVSPASVAFGNVTLNRPSTLPVTLTSSGTAPVTINSATLTGTGFTMSGATFPVTLNPSLAITLEVQFDPTVTGAVTGQVTIQSNSSTNGTVTVGLSGTGESASHQVTLTWAAPSSSSDPVAGYYVYRSTGGSSAYTLLNPSVDTQTSYVDTNVQTGLTYDYIVKSVDASGVESTASNEATATIP